MLRKAALRHLYPAKTDPTLQQQQQLFAQTQAQCAFQQSISISPAALTAYMPLQFSIFATLQLAPTW
jgi:hypothetical protein